MRGTVAGAVLHAIGAAGGGDRAPGDGSEGVVAQAHRLTTYDAAYLELAHRTGAPLATRDAELATAAKAVGVVLAL